MLRKVKKLSLIATICLAVVVLGTSRVLAADQYSVAIDNGGANRNTDIILEKYNIGANFSEQNSIVFRNASSYNIRIDIESLDPLEDTGLLQYAAFTISGESGAVSGRYPEVSERNLICVQSGGSGVLTFRTKVDYGLSNAYQGAMFKIKAVFYMQAVEEDCKVEIPDAVVNAPNTGVEGALMKYKLFFIAGAVATTGIILLLPPRREKATNEKAVGKK